jgi:hypothetical protein
MKSLKSLLLALALIVGLMGPARLAAADDKLVLKDGRTLEGTVTREVDGYIWFKFKVGSLESTQMFRPDQIVKLERDAGGKANPDPVPTTPKAQESTARAASGAPRAAILSLEETVGIFFTADSLHRAIPLLEAEGVEIVVFRINSGGGLALELQRLSDVIQNEYKPKFRVVAWIESAISAAAMTSHCIEEIYFMPQGNYGGCTMFRPDGQGGGIAAKDRELQEVLYQMEKISERGKYPTAIMRSMQIMEPLSCSFDENGDVHWYNNLKGDFIVNPEGKVLTFDAPTACRYKFGKGIANDINELGKAMGLSEVNWVGKVVPGVPYPVSRAEEYMRKFRQQVEDDQKRLNEYYFQYTQALAIAAGTPFEERGKFLGKAREALNKIKKMVDNNPNFSFLVFNVLPENFRDWYAEREEEIRKLSRRP